LRHCQLVEHVANLHDLTDAALFRQYMDWSLYNVLNRSSIEEAKRSNHGECTFNLNPQDASLQQCIHVHQLKANMVFGYNLRGWEPPKALTVPLALAALVSNWQAYSAKLVPPADVALEIFRSKNL
jgi:hypothetical protein